MRPLKRTLLLLLCLGAASATCLAAETLDILPKPVSQCITDGKLVLRDGCAISCPDSCADLADYATAMFKDRAGWSHMKRAKKHAAIILRIDDTTGGPESYRLTIDRKAVTIAAPTRVGLLYGLQSLRQLLPVTPCDRVTLSCAEVSDHPRFAWRGLHLDVSRHFFNTSEVKRFLDLMAMYKFNRFHWHLTDDQGWRIEIKSHPELTAVGAWRKGHGFVDNQRKGLNVEDGKPYGGFYTQDEIRDVVAYAARLGITVIPEVDLPGHSTAAIVACPQVFCFPEKKMEVRMEGGVSEGVMCAGREETFALLRDVLDELVTLFPSQYVHLGGDEAPKAGWRQCPRCQARIKAEGLADENELQAYFMKRLERYLNSKGRKMIGWDEIMEGGLSKTATVMSWRGLQPGTEAALAGNDVVMTPGAFTYISQPQSVNPVTQAEGDVLSMSKLYSFDPVPDGLSADAERHILGVQACQWTEHTPTERVLYYKEYPRAIAMAEVAWSPRESRQWSDFYDRLQRHLPQLTHYGVEYGAPSYDVRLDFLGENADGQPVVDFSTEVPTDIHYTLDGSDPDLSSPVLTAPLTLTGDARLKACAYRPDGSRGRITSQAIHWHRALGKRVNYVLPYSKTHDGGGDFAMTNGMLANWQGFEKQDADFIIDLGSVQSVDSITSNWMYDIMDWVLRPTSVSYLVSADGTTFDEVHTEHFTNTPDGYKKGTLHVALHKHLDNVRYIRVKATNEKINPKWHSSAGAACWIFVDEIVVD